MPMRVLLKMKTPVNIVYPISTWRPFWFCSVQGHKKAGPQSFRFTYFSLFSSPPLNPRKTDEKKKDLEGSDRKRMKLFLLGGTYNVNSKLNKV